MAFSGQTVTRPATGSEARKIAKALRKGIGITGPAHEELVKKLREVRKNHPVARKKRSYGISSKKSI
ncbi:MAG TPA: hypothetical protein VFH95_14965 [Candidatus Kapabacteria bacterium]|nr:hypothetical protein [Candidatus Kapabacteria bacterium]